MNTWTRSKQHTDCEVGLSQSAATDNDKAREIVSRIVEHYHALGISAEEAIALAVKNAVESQRRTIEALNTTIMDNAKLMAEQRLALEKLQKEVEILRQYGNKDCTAMADDVLNNPRGWHGDKKP